MMTEIFKWWWLAERANLRNVEQRNKDNRRAGNSYSCLLQVLKTYCLHKNGTVQIEKV